jgi:hypothetical protein
MENLTGRDARTTPRWAQVPVLVLLSLLTVYELACFHFTLGKEPPAWIWLGSWHMFTHLPSSHSRIDAEAELDGRWRPIDLEPLFPTRWDSGLRFAREASNPARMRVVAASACRRHPGAPERVRFTRVRWPVVAGSAAPAPGSEQREPIVTWRCGRSVSLPAGRLL